jgi:hypothetical protein
MLALPAELRDAFEPATSDLIRSWSFGAIKARRDSSLGAWPGGWVGPRGTLDDPAIFGPVHDFECACHQYVGQQFKGIICHKCGVKVGPRSLRGRRFAHMNLKSEVPHPFFGEVAKLEVLPIVPADLWESAAGEPLARLYDELVECNERGSVQDLARQYERVCTLLLEPLTYARNWGLEEAATRFACGMALIPAGAVPQRL